MIEDSFEIRKTVQESKEQASVDSFDEKSYLERYSDVARAVDQGAVPSGRSHFDLHGRAEGRIGTKILVPERIDLDAASRVLTLPIPALATKTPTVFNADKMPSGLRSTYASLWERQQLAGELSCHLLHDAIVVGAGLVFDRSGRLYSASAHQTSAAQIETATVKVRAYLAADKSEVLCGTTLLCEKIGVSNYGHWLVEMAPIAFLLRDRLGADWFLRAPLLDDCPSMSAVVRDTLDLLGIDPKRIYWTTATEPQRYERLILTSGFSHHGVMYSPLASAAFDEMAKQVRGEKPSRIWVSRSDEKRRLQGEDDICAALAARGWTIALPGLMPLRAQIAMFKDADVVAGTSGAGLTNFGFSPSSAQIISFVPAGMPDIFFWTLAQMKKQSYTEIRCHQEHSYVGAFDWDCMLMMGTSEVLSYLDAVLA